MTPDAIAFCGEDPSHDDAIEALVAQSFGPGRFARAATRIREEGPHDPALSWVALAGAALARPALAGTVRLTPVAAGEGAALLLGPLAVGPLFKRNGIGRRLVALALEGARARGHGLVVLVGDEPYYGPLGFRRLAGPPVLMPRPVDPARLLFAELAPGARARFGGPVTHEARALRPLVPAPTPRAVEPAVAITAAAA